MSLKGRMAPSMKISTKLVLDGTTETAVTDSDGVALSGIYLWGFNIQSEDDIGAEAYLKILDAGTEKVGVRLCTSANTPTQEMFSFPGPLPIEGALTVQHSADSDVDYYFWYTEF